MLFIFHFESYTQAWPVGFNLNSLILGVIIMGLAKFLKFTKFQN
jgi:hypothetical protein